MTSLSHIAEIGRIGGRGDGLRRLFSYKPVRLLLLYVLAAMVAGFLFVVAAAWIANPIYAHEILVFAVLPMSWALAFALREYRRFVRARRNAGQYEFRLDNPRNSRRF